MNKRAKKTDTFSTTNCHALIASHGTGVDLWNAFYRYIDIECDNGASVEWAMSCEAILELTWNCECEKRISSASKSDYAARI